MLPEQQARVGETLAQLRLVLALAEAFPPFPVKRSALHGWDQDGAVTTSGLALR